MIATATTTETRAEPYTLIVQETGNVAGYACGTCRLPHFVMGGRNDDTLADARSLAARCCNRLCEDCGVVISREPRCAYLYCVTCAAKRKAERGKARFDKAIKVQEIDYDGWVYWSNADNHNNGYFDSTAELREYCEDEGIDVPAYVYAAKPLKFRMDVDDWLEHALQNHHEDAGGQIGARAREALQYMLDAWCDRQGITSYHEDHTKVIVMAEFGDNNSSEHDEDDDLPMPVAGTAVPMPNAIDVSQTGDDLPGIWCASDGAAQ